MKTLAIVQARIGSTRLPGKVLKDLGGQPMIVFLLERLRKCQLLDHIVLATSDSISDDELASTVQEYNFEVRRGKEHDVLARFIEAAEQYNPEHLVRITGDCPLIDPQLVDQIVAMHLESGADYTSNIEPPTFPDGLDTEVMTFAALKRADRYSLDIREREHVTTYLRKSDGVRRVNFTNETDYSSLRWTVDTAEDLELIRKIVDGLSPENALLWTEVLEITKTHPEWNEINSRTRRNEGMDISTGQKLWQRARKVIPGGNLLLSKRPEMFLPGKWPAYFSHASGCRVWDLDHVEYLDMSIMGIGTNTLGYGRKEVDEAVRQVTEKGNMSTFNCPEEVYLAEKLVEMHPWSDMVRFARTGGEAVAIAVRIARAATGRDRIAVCGYHGWHDWYLSANLKGNDQLDDHLLPGLNPAGVPAALKGLTVTFQYRDLAALRSIISESRPAAVVMEVSRTFEPDLEFLQGVRELTKQNSIVLIFDECTSGFRETFGGLHKKYGIEPDILVLAKAIGNGYALSAVQGRREVMEYGQESFISSTFWTERIGPTAALATLAVMEQTKSWKTISEMGKKIKDVWRELARANDLEIQVSGLDALASFSFASSNHFKYKTLITQEMLKKGILAATSVYVCTDHGEDELARYAEELSGVFALIRECKDGRDIDSLLEGPVCHSGFNRLN